MDSYYSSTHTCDATPKIYDDIILKNLLSYKITIQELQYKDYRDKRRIEKNKKMAEACKYRITETLKFPNLDNTYYMQYKEAKYIYWKIKGLKNNTIAEKFNVQFNSVTSAMHQAKRRFDVKSLDILIEILLKNDFIKLFEKLERKLDKQEN